MPVSVDTYQVIWKLNFIVLSIKRMKELYLSHIHCPTVCPSVACPLPTRCPPIACPLPVRQNNYYQYFEFWESLSAKQRICLRWWSGNCSKWWCGQYAKSHHFGEHAIHYEAWFLGTKHFRWPQSQVVSTTYYIFLPFGISIFWYFKCSRLYEANKLIGSYYDLLYNLWYYATRFTRLSLQFNIECRSPIRRASDPHGGCMFGGWTVRFALCILLFCDNWTIFGHYRRPWKNWSGELAKNDNFVRCVFNFVTLQRSWHYGFGMYHRSFSITSINSFKFVFLTILAALRCVRCINEY